MIGVCPAQGLLLPVDSWRWGKSRISERLVSRSCWHLLGHSLGGSNIIYHYKLPGSRFVIVKEHIVPRSQLLDALFKSSDITFAASYLKNFIHSGSQPNLFSRRHFRLLRSCNNSNRRIPQNQAAGVKVNYLRRVIHSRTEASSVVASKTEQSNRTSKRCKKQPHQRMWKTERIGSEKRLREKVKERVTREPRRG